MIAIYVSTQELKEVTFGLTKDNNMMEFIQKEKSGNVRSVENIV